MIDDPVVVMAATPRGWAGQLRAHAADHGGVVIRATVLTPEDAIAEQCDVVLVDDITSFLTPAFVGRIQDLGRAVLGVYDASDTQGKSDLVDAGVDALVDSDSDPATLAAHVLRLASRAPQDRPPPRPAPTPQRHERGRMIGITGPGGGVGVTEVALELAAALAADRVSTVLVDADELAPSLAQRLGVAVHPNLHTALRVVERSCTPAGCVQPLATRGPLHVLSGMAAGEDWHGVRSTALAALVEALSGEYGAVVVDLGHCLPPVEGPTGMRFGNANSLVPYCDDVVLVTSPMPTGVARAIDLASRLGASRRRCRLVLNRVGADRFVRDECVNELIAATGIPYVHVLTEDPRVPRAGWQGGRVARGRFRAGIRELVDRLGTSAA